MTLPLMPKATAVWLIENTPLTFEQIGNFCGMHSLEVQGIADGEVAVGIVGQDPIAAQQLLEEELEKAAADENYQLKLSQASEKMQNKKQKGAKYTPISRRQDKPEAIAYLVKHHPYLPDSKIVKLIGTTKKTIDAIRERTHWNIQNIKAKDPVILGLCSQTMLDEFVNKFKPAGEESPAESSDQSASA